jgi:hypothetical protein
MADNRFPYDVAMQNPNKNGAGETVVFKRKEFTISRLFKNDDGVITGLQFAEDLEEPRTIFNLDGGWSQEPNPQTGKKFKLPWNGYEFQENDPVEVSLQRRTYEYNGQMNEAREVRRQQDTALIRKITHIVGSPEPVAASPEIPTPAKEASKQPAPPRNQYEINSEHIRRGIVVTFCKEVLSNKELRDAMRSVGLGSIPWAEIVAAEMTLFSQGKPSDMSYFEDMVRDKLLETYVVDVDDETSAFDLITSGSKFQKDSTPKEQGTLEQALEAIDKSYESSDVDYGDSIEINEDGEQVEKL